MSIQSCLSWFEFICVPLRRVNSRKRSPPKGAQKTTSPPTMKAVKVLVFFATLQVLATCDLVRRNYFVEEYQTWDAAQLYCRTYYEDLSTVNTPWDIMKLKRDVPYYLSTQVWVGLSKELGSFYYSKWSDGSDIGFPVWEFSEPNNVNSHNCVAIRDLELSDFNCKASLPFFCYKWVPRMVLVNMMMTWHDALLYCRTQYSDLVSMPTAKDMQVAVSISIDSQTSSVWTGLRFMDGSWFWVDQDPLGNMTTVPPCPAKPFHCGALKAGNSAWEAFDCNQKMNFLCS